MWKNSNIVYVEKKLSQILSKKQTNKLKAHLQNWLKDKECIKVFLFLFLLFFFVYIQMHCLLNVWFRQVGTTV